MLVQTGDLVPNVLCALIQIGGFEGLKEAIEIAERDEVNGLQAKILKVLIKMRVM